MSNPFTDEQKDMIQRQLVKIAIKNNFEKRENLFKVENDLISANWTSVFKSEDVKKREEVQRYLMLTSLPFLIYETDEDEIVRSMRTACEMQLQKLWKVRTAEHTAVLPTGSMHPEYMLIAGVAIPDNHVPKHCNLSYAHSVFLRKALISSGLHQHTWITHILKFPGVRLERELIKQHPFIEQEVAALQPRMIIALGKQVKQALAHLSIPIALITEPEYYEKHGHAYQDYSEAVKNVVSEQWRIVNGSK